MQMRLHQHHAIYFTFQVLIHCADTNEVLSLLLSLPQERFAALKQSGAANQILLVQHGLVFQCNLRL